MYTVSRLITLAAAFLCVALFAVPAAAAVSVPITLKYSGSFVFTDPNTCERGQFLVTDTLTGTSSHLGRVAATYPHCVDFAAGTFSGTATFTAANGDELVVPLGGSADPTCTTTCAVTFTGSITGGTGRFEGAEGEQLTGTGTVNLHAFTIEAELTGTINKHPMPF